MTSTVVDSHVVRFEALGSRFVVTCASAQDAGVIRRQWSRLSVSTPVALRDVPIDLTLIPVGNQGRALLSDVTIRAIEAAAGHRLMLHAAGLADSEGRVLALVGPSGMGKTTAAVHLARHGFGYVTDETVSMGPEGDVLLFPRPLSLRLPDGEVQRSPDELNLGVPPDGLTIARLVLLDRIPGHLGPPVLNAVPLLDAMLELIPHASALARLHYPLSSLSRTIDRCGGVLRLTYGELDEQVVALLRGSLGEGASTPAAAGSWQPLLVSGPAERQPSGSGDLGSDSEFLQGTVRDGIVADGEALVLVEDIPVRLSEVGLTIWRAAQDGVARADIVSVVEEQHGTHPDAHRIVFEAVDQMLASGLLVAGAGVSPSPAAAR